MNYTPGDQVEVQENGRWKRAVVNYEVRPGRYRCTLTDGDFGIYAERDIRPAAREEATS